jgi:DNA (cytosine-5)-methyltransferase 1
VNELALFAGAGGGILGGKLLGWRTVCAVEWESYPASVLIARQNDGLLPPFPIWDDVRTFDGSAWRGLVDVVSGGFPCQDISVAGKGAGIDGARSSMWTHMARIIGEVRPRFAFVENSPALLTRGLGTVLSDLAALGYDCRWTVLGAADVGAPHKRDRFWLVATDTMQQRPAVGTPRQAWGALPDADRDGAQKEPGWDELKSRACCCGSHVADAGISHVEGQRKESERVGAEFGDFGDSGWWESEPSICRVADGVAARVDRLKAIGNGQVPQCAAEAWRMLAG